MKTQSILGYELTLEAGKKYLAIRPLIGGRIGKGALFPVKIVDAGDPLGDAVAAYVDDMPYDKANEFINAFNNGETSFEGRKW